MEHISTEHLLDYVDGRLAPQEHKRVEQHLDDCAACRAEVASLRQTISMLAEDDWVMPPARVRASVQRAFRQQAPNGESRPSLLEWLGALLAPRRGPALALALLLVILAVGVAYRVLQTPPSSPTLAASAVSGPAEVQSAGSEEWQLLQGGTSLNEGDLMRTGSGASALLTFADGSTTQVQAESLLAVTALQSDPRTVALEQRRGDTRNRVLPAAEADARFEIGTPSALITTEGAEFDVIVDKAGATQVTVSSGELSIMAAGSSLRLRAGEEANVLPGQPPQLVSPEPTPTATSTPTATPSATATASSTPTLAPPAPTATATMEPPPPTEEVDDDDDTPEPTEEPDDDDDDDDDTPEPTEEPDDDDDDTPEPTEEPDDDDDDTPEPTEAPEDN